MGLLTPWFLAGLAALGLPVWLHLLKKHRTTPQPFASLMFFERRTQSSVKHRRLLYLLLFSLRMALLALLALAFARPYFTRSTAAAAGQKLVVAAVDNSFSMRQGGRLAQAKAEAERVAAGAARAQVLAFASGVLAMTEPTTDRDAVRAAIRAIAPTDARGSFAALARAVRAMREPVELHVFSDMQRSSLPANFGDLALPEGATLTPHIAGRAAPNYAVESVKAPSHVYGDGKLRVEAVVAGYGAPAASRRAALVVNGREVAAREVAVPQTGRAAVEFPPVDAPFGPSRCEVRIDADAFPDDDHYLFAVERGEPRPVLFVQETPGGRALLYFRAALEAGAPGGFRVEPVTSVNGIDPARYAFVVLSDVGGLPPAFEAALERYRGGVLIALGRAAVARRRAPLTGAAITGTAAGTAECYGAQVRFETAARVDPAGGQVSATLPDGAPLLITARNRVTFASTFDGAANDFPLHAGFVPFVTETVQRLAGGGQDRAAYTVDAFLPLRPGVEVLDPSGNRVLSLAEASRAEGIHLVKSGFYDMKRELAAVNPDRRESDLEPMPAETLALWRGTGGAAPGRGGTAGPARVELWWYLALAAAAVALAESLVGNRHLAGEKARREAA
ncbi:MAG: BatA domain-containing protein [Bryobacteraceae bacterium]